MKFPVDLLADASQQQLEKLAHEYLNTLRYSNPDDPERLTLSDSTQVKNQHNTHPPGLDFHLMCDYLLKIFSAIFA